MTNSSKPWIAECNPFASLCKSLSEKLSEVRPLKFLLWFLVAAYRSLGTTHLGGACRFTPSCSEYALDAIHEHSPHKAVWLISKRICKCRPGGPFGYDPVPAFGETSHAEK